jgi:hypothetical protein
VWEPSQLLLLQAFVAGEWIQMRASRIRDIDTDTDVVGVAGRSAKERCGED